MSDGNPTAVDYAKHAACCANRAVKCAALAKVLEERGGSMAGMAPALRDLGKEYVIEAVRCAAFAIGAEA